MDEKLKALRDSYDAKSKEAQGLLDKGPEITQEDVLKVQTLNGELKDLSDQISTLHDAQKLGAEAKARDEQMRRPVATLPFPGGEDGGGGGDPPPGGRADVLGFASRSVGYTDVEEQKGMRVLHSRGAALLGKKEWEAIQKPEYKAAWHSYLALGWHGISNGEQKVLQEGNDTAGGFLVPDEVLNRIIMRKPTPTRIQNYVTSLTTSRDSLSIPKVIYTTDDLYTTGIRATFTGEIPATSTSHRATEPVFGQVRVPIYTVMLSVPVTMDLIEDAAVDLLGWLEARFAETIELLIDNMILNGTGVGQPSGVLVNPGGTDQPAVVVSGDATTLGPAGSGDSIINLGWSLPEQYDDNAIWIMNKTNTGRQVALMKDDQGRYLWGMGYQDSGLSPPIRGRELLGYPVIFSGFMPNVGANTYPILFGDPRGIYLVRRIGFSVQVLRELYAETNQILLLARLRFGAALAESWRIRAMKIST